jgi:NAD(P)H-hydrate epimerase
LDLGFFEPRKGAFAETSEGDRVLLPDVLTPLSRLRASQSDKRDYGHLFLIGGSRHYPGAILMSVLAALKSGAGLVTACVPENLVPAYAARAPEAMWVGLPEAPEGGLTPEALPIIAERWGRASAVHVGPGMGRSPATQALLLEIAKSASVPLVLDAEALLPDVVREARLPRILTPHIGEFARIARGGSFKAFCAETGATVVLKGPVTCVASTATATYHGFFGGPVLSRGGSGDILSGLIGGLLAQSPGDPTLAACRGVVWHGLAADALARAHGQTSARVTELVELLPAVIRNISMNANAF